MNKSWRIDVWTLSHDCSLCAHRNISSAYWAIIFNFGPMFQAINMKDMFFRTSKDINFIPYSNILIAYGTVSSRIGDILQFCIFNWNLNKYFAISFIPTKAAKEYKHNAYNRR